jgi:tetratricopeptide (TPR) repeat protein
MNRFNKNSFLFVFIIALLTGFALFSQEAIPPGTSSVAAGIFVSKAIYGESIRFELDSNLISVNLRDAKTISLQAYSNLLDPPVEIPMNVSEGIWQASYMLRDTSVKVLFFGFLIESSSNVKRPLNAGQTLWDVLVVNVANRPVFGAHQAVALSYTGMSDQRPENLDEALSELDEELALYPDNYSARMLKYQILLKKDGYQIGSKTKIKNEVDALLQSRAETEQTLNFAVGAYRLIGENGKAGETEKALLALNPKGERAAMKRFSEILQIKQADSRVLQFSKFLNDYSGSSMVEPALSQLASASIEIGDTSAMTSAGDRLLRDAATSTGANALAGIAGVLADRRSDLDRAYAYIQKALALNESASFQGAVTQEQEEERSTDEARYLDVLGWIQFQKNDLQSAIDNLMRAEKSTLQAPVFFHLGAALEKAGKREDALMRYGRAAAFSGAIGESAEEAFRQLWKKVRRDTLAMNGFLDEQAKWVEQAGKVKILSKRSIRPAPDFKLRDVNGGWVRLADQRGTAVLLCVWGTWSQSSRLLLNKLQELAQEYGQNVLFLTVAMDQDARTIQKFVSEKRLVLPVLENDRIEEKYRIEGIPTIYVIDAKGNIQFTHRGYRDDINRILSIEIDDILGMKSQ